MGFFKFKNKDYDRIVTEAIENIDFEPVALQGEFKLYCGSDITGGYRFLNCNIVGPFQTRTKKGCRVFFSDGMSTIEVESETVEISSDYSDTLKIGVTAFVLEIDSHLEGWIQNELIRSILIKFPKREIEFNTILHNIFKETLSEEKIDDSEE